MITDSLDFWDCRAKQTDWQEYVLPGKTPKEFFESGIDQAQFLKGYFDSGATVLDYGCGVGRVLKHISPFTEKAIGIDISNGLIEKARKYCKGIDNIELGTIAEYMDKEGLADFIYCLMVLQHNSQKSREAIMYHIYRLLKKGGDALIQFPMRSSPIYIESDFVHKFTATEIKRLAYGFDRYEIFKGNLTAYQSKKFNSNIPNEYFLRVWK